MDLFELFEGRSWGRGAPGFGFNGFPGYNLNLFGPSRRNCIGAHFARKITDSVLRYDVADWLTEFFRQDRPAGEVEGKRGAFPAEEFNQAVSNRDFHTLYFSDNTHFQSRHFWYTATLVGKEPVIPRRIFLCHTFNEIFMKRGGEFYLPSRWEDNCGIPERYREFEPEDRRRTKQDDD